jgi:hypothetical protein
MSCDFDFEIHFFFELAFEAVARALAEFQSAAGEFRIVAATDEFIAYQDFFVFS